MFRAELRAVLLALQLTLEEVEIITHCKGVATGFAQGRHLTPSGRHADLWDTMGRCPGDSQRARERWCPAHLDEARFAAHGVSPSDVAANEGADTLAKLAAALVAVPDGEVSRIRKLDAKARAVQQRLIQVHQEAAERRSTIVHREKRRRQLRDTDLLQLERDSGHRFCFHGTQIRCLRCKQSSPAKLAGAWMRTSRCPGPLPQTQRPEPTAAGPLGRSSMHPSHSVVAHRGLLWCWRCASYAVTSGQRLMVRTLAAPCKSINFTAKQPLSRYYVWRRLARGLTPKRRLEWPLPDEGDPPACLAEVAETVATKRGLPVFEGGRRIAQRGAVRSAEPTADDSNPEVTVALSGACRQPNRASQPGVSWSRGGADRGGQLGVEGPSVADGRAKAEAAIRRSCGAAAAA